MLASATNTRSRLPLSAVNVARNQGGDDGSVLAKAISNGEGSGTVLEFSSREDVERLLAEKAKPRNRNDLKSRMEEMREFIKKLRCCISWFIEREDEHLAEQQKLHDLLESEERRHSDSETQMNGKIRDLNSLIEELQTLKASLEETISKEESDKLVIP
ncbi:Kinesin-2 [Apostasia shenzhenica]|uniref:Kinesin-2 n=1 Tax=Apostasia shenzhenica TaxID=1088818 RepID=A0A2I0B753_9ASPA|nr:Kinesin-2 [Apostasia shenzhenica]